MTYTVDTLIANLESKANAFYNAGFGYTNAAQGQVAGDAQAIEAKAVGYVAPPSTTTIDGDLPSWLYNSPAATIVKNLRAELELYFGKFFPNINTQYDVWIGHLVTAVNNGVPLTLDNHVANAQRQAFDKAEGMRAQRAIRASWSARGHCLPAGGMVGDILDESDKRTEQLIQGAIGSANQATEQVLNSYKTIISTALSTADARVAAVNAMSALISTAADIYRTDAEAKVAIARARVAAAEAALAYYSAETRLDSLNTNLYRQNTQFGVQRFGKDAELFFKNEAKQVDTAIAGAEQAAKIAQAAYSALNTVVSASTVGFG